MVNPLPLVIMICSGGKEHSISCVYTCTNLTISIKSTQTVEIIIDRNKLKEKKKTATVTTTFERFVHENSLVSPCISIRITYLDLLQCESHRNPHFV